MQMGNGSGAKIRPDEKEAGGSAWDTATCTMTVHRYLRSIAGAFVLITLSLGYFGHSAWFLFTGRRHEPRPRAS